MATVYLAHDLKHDRPVALKILRPELAFELGADRFQREIILAARLQHPHILPVHDSGEAAGELWFTMPFVEGESLRGRLTREPQLPLEDALRIVRQTADALDYAHRHGVVHRDVKPENILLTGDHALVADFGIARAFGGSGGESRLTSTGMAVGTPAYMSPEQASGDRGVDQRSDVYALGCVLYEMLAGEPPFAGPTAQAIRARALSESPRPIHVVRPRVPPALDRVIARALAIAPADRFASAADFARALETAAGAEAPRRGPPVATLAIGFLLGVGVLFAWLRTRGGEGEARILAVLPFENIGSRDQEYFADGMTDEVRGRLAALPGLQVIGRASSTPFKRTTTPPQQIAQELGAQYLLTGTVRWEQLHDGRSVVHVSPELVQVRGRSAPTTTWQQSFDAELTDVFQVQADIATRVAQALDVALGAEARRRLAEPPTDNVAAYDAFLRGEEVTEAMAGNPLEFSRAVTYYEGAVALDSSFADAWAQLSRTHAFIYAYAAGTRDDSAAALRAAERALALAPHGPATHLAWGDYYRLVAANHSLALDHYAQGHRLAPSNALLLMSIAGVEYNLGRFAAALDHFRQAQRLDPRVPATSWALGIHLVALRRYPEALAAFEHGLGFAPANLDLIQGATMVHLGRGDLAAARSVLRGVPSDVDPATLAAYMATYWDLMWVLDDAQQQLLLRLTPRAFGGDRGLWSHVRAQTYALRGDAAQARAFADTARIVAEERLRGSPGDATQRAALGLALAYLGRTAEAKREGERAVALMPIGQGVGTGAYLQHQLVRIYVQVNEPDKALDYLEPLLGMPYLLSPGWLKIDPNFAPLRGNARFERLIAAPGSS